jgi:GNAT superfamily N-acetyltransferase
MELKFEENIYGDDFEIFAILGEQRVGNISGHASGGELDIGSVFVEPSCRGKGVGLALYEGLLRAAARAGILMIHSHDPSDAAKVVHKRLVDKYALKAPSFAWGYDSWTFENPFLASPRRGG